VVAVIRRRRRSRRGLSGSRGFRSDRLDGRGRRRQLHGRFGTRALDGRVIVRWCRGGLDCLDVLRFRPRVLFDLLGRRIVRLLRLTRSVVVPRLEFVKLIDSVA